MLSFPWVPTNTDQQRLVLEVDFHRQAIKGHAEITVTPKSELQEIYLNCRQLKILQITVDRVPAKYTYQDPFCPVVTTPSPKNAAHHPQFRRNLIAALNVIGELAINIPPNVQRIKEVDGTVPKLTNGQQENGSQSDAPANPPIPPEPEYLQLVIAIDYVLDHPTAGVHFVMPHDADPYRHPHMHISTQTSEARLWMPCFDQLQQRCSWEIDIIIPRTESDAVPTKFQPSRDEEEDREREMIAVCSGTLLEQIVHPACQDKKIFSFYLEAPVMASSVTVAVGPFEVLPVPGWARRGQGGSEVPDEDLLEEGEEEEEDPGGFAFCLPERVEEMEYTLEFFAQAVESMEAYMTTSYPFSVFNMVFVEDNFNAVVTGATMAIVSTHLLLNEKIIDQVYDTRALLCRAFASQWFGHFIAPKNWNDMWLFVGLVNHATGDALKKIFGTNEHKYRMKQDIERVVQLDVNQPPLRPKDPDPDTCDKLLLTHFDPLSDPLSPRSQLLALKSPLVLHMLNRRFKILSKIIHNVGMSAISGELTSGLSTHKFFNVANKILKSEESTSDTPLKAFEGQWVDGSGCPKFCVKWAFNKKRMEVDFEVEQENSNKGGKAVAKPVQGNLVVRVQEPGGQYDWSIKLDGGPKNADSYNYKTKYKRIRTKGGKKAKKEESSEESSSDDSDSDSDETSEEEDLPPKKKAKKDEKSKPIAADTPASSQLTTDTHKPAVVVNTNLRALVFGAQDSGTFSLFGGSTDPQPEAETDTGGIASNFNFNISAPTTTSTFRLFEEKMDVDEPTSSQTEQYTHFDTTEITKSLTTSKLFFLHIDNPELKHRSNYEPDGTFMRKESMEEIQKRWEEVKGELTEDYKRKHK
ncbi:hypothetical protein HK097_011598, partial [Rhizophlyctis rosea]